MRPLGVVKQNPVCNDSAGMLDGLKPVAVHALLFEGSNHPLYNAVCSQPYFGAELVLAKTGDQVEQKLASGQDNRREYKTNVPLKKPFMNRAAQSQYSSDLPPSELTIRLNLSKSLSVIC